MARGRGALCRVDCRGYQTPPLRVSMGTSGGTARLAPPIPRPPCRRAGPWGAVRARVTVVSHPLQAQPPPPSVWRLLSGRRLAHIFSPDSGPNPLNALLCGVLWVVTAAAINAFTQITVMTQKLPFVGRP